METITTTDLQQEAEEWPGIVSRFQLVILAGLRSKQLFRGAKPRIHANALKRRNTSIALEELKQGLVPFRGQQRHNVESMLKLSHTPIVVEHGSEIELGTE